MKQYAIAGLTVEMACSGRTERSARPYEIQSEQTPDLSLVVTAEHIEEFRAKYPDAQILDWEYFLLSQQFSSCLLPFNGFVFHASAVTLDGNAYLFSADSGTGKSTHTALWCRVFPEAKILNDDKPAIRLMDGRFYACGTPWSGKSDLNRPENVPLKAICFLERGSENTIERLTDPQTILPLFFTQTLRKMSADKTTILLSLLDRLIADVPFYRLTCRPDEEAARVAHDGMQ